MVTSSGKPKPVKAKTASTVKSAETKETKTTKSSTNAFKTETEEAKDK